MAEREKVKSALEPDNEMMESGAADIQPRSTVSKLILARGLETGSNTLCVICLIRYKDVTVNYSFFYDVFIFTGLPGDLLGSCK